MPTIRPVSDLRNNFKEISDVCHENGEPVFLTKNGRGDMVVMSIAQFEKQQALLELYKKLGEAEKESENNAPTTSHDDLMNQMRKKLNE
ncbi:type II toxin-antitoxin system Phd/YefM family antitoxin [Halanaerobium sp. ST460_2HS_T2]|jgi:prevent-host-death family protein|uniref:type II toxin-antitoxin system Phd/YefM family antitoxin n=1 Tax=Halanaerobium sp. ST460_2HS_T2 TaxID=2183914 RepID=UPI000DF2729A|nr:type II toxin-antitoxin system Phd/YefM family antitoxin [Halanaerobium sp. ST460_2HS_T2]RCW51594.1 prevent-host-death family protein [Halanaerobium sp. ST460_2HS_T2]